MNLLLRATSVARKNGSARVKTVVRAESQVRALVGKKKKPSSSNTHSVVFLFGPQTEPHLGRGKGEVGTQNYADTPLMISSTPPSLLLRRMLKSAAAAAILAASQRIRCSE